MLRRITMLGGAAIAAVLLAVPAQAAPVIDFTGQPGPAGAISWNGTNLIGWDIPIADVSISGAPANNGVFEVTGTSIGYQNSGPWGTLAFNTSPDNNYIAIFGCIAALGIGIDAGGNCTPTSLMTGTFTSFTDAPQGLIAGVGMDTKNSQLMDAIGWPDDLPWEFFGFVIATNNLSPNGTPSSVVSTDIRNTAVPEPATMVLLGTGLLAAFRARRRQQV